MKKGQIINFHNEITDWINKGSVLAYFNRSRIQDFYKEYNTRIQKIQKEINDLRDSYYVVEDGKIKIAEDGKPIMLEGKTNEEANQSFQDLMNQDVSEGIQLIKPLIAS
jgi:hypothetical protein